MWNVNKTPFTPWLATRFCINSLETLTSLFCLSFLKCAQLKLGADGFPALSSFIVSGNHFGYQWFFSPKEFGRDAKLNVQGCTESTLNVCLIASNQLSPVISRTGNLSFISAAGTRWLTAHLLDTVVLQRGPPWIRSVLPHPTDAPLGSGKDGSRLDPQAIPEQTDLLGYVADVGQWQFESLELLSYFNIASIWCI